MSDLIRRQAVIDLFKTYQPRMATSVIEFGNALKELPTVEAEPEHGHWIDEGVYADNFPHHAWRCSKCGWHELEIEEPYGNYCRNCGAKMDEVRHETD